MFLVYSTMFLPIIILVLIACTPEDPDDLDPDPIACSGGFIVDDSECVHVSRPRPMRRSSGV